MGPGEWAPRARMVQPCQDDDPGMAPVTSDNRYYVTFERGGQSQRPSPVNARPRGHDVRPQRAVLQIFIGKERIKPGRHSRPGPGRDGRCAAAEGPQPCRRSTTGFNSRAPGTTRIPGGDALVEGSPATPGLRGCYGTAPALTPETRRGLPIDRGHPRAVVEIPRIRPSQRYPTAGQQFPRLGPDCAPPAGRPERRCSASEKPPLSPRNHRPPSTDVRSRAGQGGLGVAGTQ